MPRYLIERDVTGAGGSQTFYVDADSEKEALEKYNNGEGDMYSDDSEITALGEPEITGVTSDDDFGILAAGGGNSHG